MVKSHHLHRLFIYCSILLLGWACKPMEEQQNNNDKLLAKVFNKSLYLSELEGMFPGNAKKQDSTLFINAFIERWVRESVMMNEAEHNIPKDLNIDKLVRDYRASLILHNYEKKLVEVRLDSTITQQELNNYYQKNKEQFQLESTLLRCYFMKLPSTAPDLDDVPKWWNSTDEEEYKKLLEYCTANADVYMLKDSTWYNMEAIASQFPKGVITNNVINTQKEFTHRDSSYQYYLKVFDTVSKGNIAPLPYIENQAKKVILHKRKIDLLDKTKEEMYEKEMRRKNITIYN